MNYEKIGEFIAEKRKEKNLTQVELAKKLGVTDKAVSKWERGLGCPDVSILEVLSKELDVSILELLKGREIENEVIKVTEADDYIKDTFKVSKSIFNKELKKKINITLMSISIFIIGIMCIFNINTYKRLTKKETIEVSFIYDNEWDEENDSLNDKKNTIKKYANLIEKNKGSLTDAEQTAFVNCLNDFYEFYDKADMFNIKDGTKISFNDVYISLEHDFSDYGYPRTLPILRIYREHISDKYPESLRERLIKVHDTEEYFINTYDDMFRSLLQFEIEDKGFDTVDNIYRDIIEAQIGFIDPFLEITEDIMKEAGIHE